MSLLARLFGPLVVVDDHREPLLTPALTYLCRRCDVTGYVGPGMLQVCWACEFGDRLEAR